MHQFERDFYALSDNYPDAFKRPLSSTAPTIIENVDGTPYLVIGGSGGSHIFPAIFQVILNLDWGYDVSQAIEFGRLNDQLYPENVAADSTYPGELLADLESRGHVISGMYLVIIRLFAFSSADLCIVLQWQT